MSGQELVRKILVTVFILIMLPILFSLTGYLTSPDPSLDQWVNLFRSVAVPWWIGIPKVSPLLLVLLFLVVSWADAEEIL